MRWTAPSGTIGRRMGEGEARRADAVGAGFVALAALLFGSTVILGKLLANRDFPVTSMLAIRFGAAAVLIGLLLTILRRSLSAARGEGLRLLGLGAVGYAAESALFFLALKHGTVAAVTLLFFTYPVWVALLSAVFGLGMPGWVLSGSLAAAVAGAGLVAASSGGVVVSAAGIAFALGAAATFSLYLVGVDVVLKRTPALTASMWVAGSAALMLGTVALVGSTGQLPDGAAEWGPVLGMGAFTAGAFTSLFVGLRRLGAVRSSIIAAMEPVAAAVLAGVILGEDLPPGTIAGGLLILAGAVVATIARARRAGPKAGPSSEDQDGATVLPMGPAS